MKEKKFLKNLSRINEYIILIIIFSIPLFFAWNNDMYNVFELNKLILFRVLLYFSITITSMEVLFKSFILNKVSRNAIILSIFFLISLLLSTIFSVSPSTALWGNYYREQGFFTFLHYIIFFIVFLYEIKSLKQIERVLKAIIFSSFFVCFYGILQATGLDFFAWKEGAISTGRIFSSLGQPNFLGHYLIVVFPVTLYYLIILRKFLFRFFISLILFLQIICIILSYSRSSWLGLITILSFIALYIIYKFYRNKKFRVYIFTFLFLFFIFFIGFFNYLNSRPVEMDEIRFFDRIRSITDLNYGSNKIRFLYWGAAIKGFNEASLENKLFGHGLDTSQYVFTKYYQPDWAIYETVNMSPDKAHNLLLDILLQIGIVGLFAYLLLIVYAILCLYGYLKIEKNKKKRLLVFALGLSLLGYFVNNLFSFSSTTTYLYFYVFIGLLLIISSDKNEKQTLIKINTSHLFKIIILISFIFTSGIFLYYYNINLYKAEKKLYLSLKQKADNNCHAAMKSVQEARELYSVANYYDIFYVSQLSKCLEDTNYLNTLIKSGKNIEINLDIQKDLNYNLTNLSQVAYLKAQLGKIVDSEYYELAENDFKEILEINSNVPLVYSNMSKMFFLKKEYDKAIIATRKAISLLPSIDNVYLNKDHKDEIKKELANNYDVLASSFMILGELDKAIESYGKAIENNPYFSIIYKKRADAYYLKGELDNAIKSLERGLTINKDDYAWPWALAQIYKEKKDSINAVKYAEMALEKNNGNEEIVKFIANF